MIPKAPVKSERTKKIPERSDARVGCAGAAAIGLDDGPQESRLEIKRCCSGRRHRATQTEASRLEREAKAVRVEMKADLEEIQFRKDADRLERGGGARRGPTKAVGGRNTKGAARQGGSGRGAAPRPGVTR